MAIKPVRLSPPVVRKVVVNRSAGFYYLTGCLLLANALFVTAISDRFSYELDLTLAPVSWYVISQVFAGFLLLSLPVCFKQLDSSSIRIAFAIIIGLVARLLMFDTAPILEIDFYRYLWDGAVLFNGYNPYATPPLEIPQLHDPVLDQLVVESGNVLGRINYSHLTTIYPPLAQGFFALSYWIDNWQLDAWRLVLLIADFFTLTLIVVILKELKRSLLWLTIYWWNPLVITEIFNSGHMEGLIAPFLLSAILFLIKKRQILSSSFMVLAAAIKIWPLLLIPFCCRPFIRTPVRLMVTIVLIVVLAGLFFLPYLLIDNTDSSGLFVFSQEWQRGGGIFHLLNQGLQLLIEKDSAGQFSRFLVGFLILLLVLYFNIESSIQPQDLIKHISWVVFCLILLSPVQLPWYTLWFATFLCFVPNSAMLLFMALAPLYYLRWHFADLQGLEFLIDFINWLQLGPVIVILLLQFVRKQMLQRKAGLKITNKGESFV